jgi:hypothetical protein
MRAREMAEEGGKVLSCLLIPLSVFCALAAYSLSRSFSGLSSVFRLILLASWLFFVGILAEWKYNYG